MAAMVLGRSEIAQLLEVDKHTPHAWYARGLMPPPDYERVNGYPAWDRDTIMRWATETGRLPDSLCVEAKAFGYGENAPTRGGRQAARQTREKYYDR